MYSEADVRALHRIHSDRELGRVSVRAGGGRGVRILEREKQWRMAGWLLLSSGGSGGGLAILPALLLPIAARDGAAGRARLHVAGTMARRCAGCCC